MKDEIIDIVDPHNHVLSQTSKLQAHAEGLLHRIIIAELVDPKGNFTLVKQAPDRQDPDQFVSPVGGHIRAGESEIEALIRETQEELGIDLSSIINHQPSSIHRLGAVIFNREVIGRKENHLFIV